MLPQLPSAAASLAPTFSTTMTCLGMAFALASANPLALASFVAEGIGLGGVKSATGSGDIA